VDDTKSRLLTAAGEIFAEKGYEAASVREICQRASANIAAVNYHFGEKRQLYVAAVREAQCAQAVQLELPAWPDQLPPVERLRRYIHVMFKTMLASDRPKWHLELMLRELARPTEACEAVVEDYIRPMADQLRVIIRDLTPHLTDDQRWPIGFSIVGQVLFYYVHQPIIRLLIGPIAFEALSVDELAEHVTRFSLAALGFDRPVTSGPIPSFRSEVTPGVLP
jgi:TetR/AcrR family transcriptional regulator, regulator of cefoperazone and chloramphenicol sensitivity